MNEERDHTKGNILKNLISLAWPGIAGRFFENLHGIVDLIWIGMLGGAMATQAQAALVIFGVVFAFVFIFNNLFGLSSVSIISRYWGEKNYKKAEWAAEQTILFKFVFGVAGAILTLILLETFLSFAGASAELSTESGYSVVGIALVYGRIILIATPFWFTYFTFNTIFRCTSDAETGMFLTIMSVIINVVLDPLMILGIGVFPKMGIAGAAWATVIAQMCSFILGLILLSTGYKFRFVQTRFSIGKIILPKLILLKRGIKISLQGLLKPDISMMLNMMRIGTTPALSNLFNTGSGMIFMNIVSSYNNDALLSAFGIGMRLIGLVNMPLLGLQQAAGSLVGQNLGANSPYRAEKTVWYSVLIALSLSGSMVAISYLFGGHIYSVFNREAEVIAFGSSLLGLAMLQNTTFSIKFMITSSFEGSGYTLWPMIFDTLATWLVLLPILYFTIVVFKFGYEWIFISGIIANSVQLFVSLMLMRMGRWKTARI